MTQPDPRGLCARALGVAIVVAGCGRSPESAGIDSESATASAAPREPGSSGAGAQDASRMSTSAAVSGGRAQVATPPTTTPSNGTRTMASGAAAGSSGAVSALSAAAGGVADAGTPAAPSGASPGISIRAQLPGSRI